MPLECRLPEGQMIKKIFESMKEMVADVNLECSEAGISVQAMDASHVALVGLVLKTGAFNHYVCDRSRTLGLNMTQVSKIFKLCGNDDQVIIRNDDEQDTINFIFECLSEDKVSNFELRLMQFEQEHLGVPEVDFSANVTMPSRSFAKIISDLSSFSDTMAIEVTPKGIKFASRGDFGSGSTVLKSRSGEGEHVEIRCEEPSVHLTFASRYLQYFAKASPLAETVRIRLSSGHPLEVQYNLNDDPHCGTMKFYLAPKMDDSI